MAQPQLLQVKLSRFDAQPWGFRLQGGVDFAQPLLVQKVNAGSLSEQAGLQPGDAVIKINDVDVFNFRHKDAQDTVVRSGNNFVITVQRGGSTWRPQVTPTGNVPQANSPYLQTVTKTSLAHKQQDSQHIGCGYNNSARPFANGGGDGGVKSIVNKQYNTPVGIYSDESIAETLSAQAEVLAGGVLGVNFKKNEKEYQADRSEVLKFLREEETGQSTPEPHSPANFYWTQSHAIGGNERRTPLHHQHQDERIGIPLQSGSLAPAAPHRPSLPVAKPEAQEGAGQEQEQTDPRIIVLPICPALQGPEYKADMEAAAAALASEEGRPRPLSASGHPACQLCGVGIVGVFVRIKDKNLHVECFKCATCGTSLKNQGYYNFNNKLYCDIHAKQAAQNNPPAGTDGYVPVPIRPNTKLSANTISSALSSHGYGSNGYSNGNSTPAPAPPEPEPEPEPELVEAAIELPLPPPPSPTQLLQYEAEEEPLEALPATAVQVQIQVQPQQPPHQLKQQQQHTRTHSSLSSISSGSSSSGVGGSGSASGAGHSQQSSSTLSLDLDRDRYAYGSPMHSRQTSASSTSLDVSAVGGSGTGGGGGIQADNYTMPPSPPPPQPQTPAHAPFRVETSIRVGAQNENDMNTQNKGHNVYNQLLKEYSNKLQHQQHHTNNNNNNTTAHTQPRHNNNTAKPFATSSVAATTQQQPLVAALTATLANQLKFNSHQVASPQAALSTAAPATVVDSSSTNPTPIAAAAPATAAGVSSYTDNMSDEPSSIYGQMNAPQPTGAPGDPAFEYVTLTGNVIRSVQAPGKGPGISYKVNQGYARPYGASAGPPSAAPKSPVAYPPQQQQQSPRPAAGGNPYATLPRTNVGQQAAVKQTNPHANPNHATLPRPVQQATDLPASQGEQPQIADSDADADATAMLAESIGRINMGDKTNAFMQEAGKIISSMLEARLTGNGSNGSSAPLSHAGSSLSLRSNSSSNLSKSPMIVRKRLDLDDFKNIDPTQPVALQSVVALAPQKESMAEMGAQKAQPQVPRVEQQLQMELPAQHPMSRILDICDNGKVTPQQTPEPVAFRNNLRRTGATHAADRRSYIEPKQQGFNTVNAVSSVTIPTATPTATPTANQSAANSSTQQVSKASAAPSFSVSVKALGPHSEGQSTMSEENEKAVSQLLKDGKRPVCCQCNKEITSGPFITALGRIWCPDHFICVNGNCRRPLQDIGFVEEKGDLYCEYCFEKYLAPTCSKCAGKIKGDCLNAIGKHFHPECFTCGQCGKVFGNRPFFLEDGNAYCEADWNELFTTKCFACGFPVEAGDRWVEALNHNYHSQCFNCTYCKQNLEGQSFYNKGGRPFCKNHAR
ncbi:PDZ and LIM domain protein Zasp isoform X15 [Drosophila subobscura]|uniref:PDZ and LIM domain protein Zasp isoform X15 n=1 Tax=Drosophila subobscura TaxID=7241 RepID=UPI00155AB4AE|nr:PDZ and LIM domain protein Zasp isoform X15 [Drosophila subobscura]